MSVRPETCARFREGVKYINLSGCHNRRMKIALHSLPRIAFAALLIGLASCSLWHAPWSSRAKAAPAPPPEKPLEAALPEPTFRFELAAEQDIVGHVQITTASKEDTLTDIARRF